MIVACLRAVALGLILPLAVAAHERPLSPHAIREGYFLGRRRDETTAKFLAQYVRRLPLPKKGPHVAEVEFRTPYQQVVLRARVAPNGYSSQQATQDYRARQDLILVRVRINFTPTYPAESLIRRPQTEPVRIRPEDFWRDFSINLVQERRITPRRVTGKPIYVAVGDYGGMSLAGADVELEFDAAQVESVPVRVEVLTPDGQRVVAEFDLSKLR